jgi:hypothetical protein
MSAERKADVTISARRTRPLALRSKPLALAIGLLCAACGTTAGSDGSTRSPPTMVSVGSESDTSDPNVALGGLIVDAPDLVAGLTHVERQEIQGVVSSGSLQRLIASRSVVWFDEGHEQAVSAAVVQVFGDVTADELVELFGPFDADELKADGTIARRSWYGLVWLEDGVAVAVQPTRGDPDVLALADLLDRWNGRSIEFLGPLSEEAEVMPSHSGLPTDVGPAYVTSYSSAPSDVPVLTITLVTRPAEPAAGRLINPLASYARLANGVDAVLVPPPGGATDTPAQLTWDLDDGGQVTVVAAPGAPGEAVDIDWLIAVASSTTRIDYERWVELASPDTE